MSLTLDARRRYRTAADWSKFNADVHPCNCVGPQDGNPVCPCRMRSLRILNGRWVEIIDHGPAPMAVPNKRSDGDD